MIYRSSIHRVLGISELLELIFSHVDQFCNARNACVCKHWANVALDFLWREVRDLARLFTVLGPLERESEVVGEDGITHYTYVGHP